MKFTLKRVCSLVMAAVLLICGILLISCGKKGTDYIVLDENFGAENYAIGFRRDDNALTLKIQEILDAMIADGAAGEIAVKWFGSDVMLRDVDFPREIKEIEGDTSLQYILDKGELILGL